MTIDDDGGDDLTLWTVEEIVRQTGLSRSTIDRAIKNDKTFPLGKWLGNRRHYKAVLVRAWVNSTDKPA